MGFELRRRLSLSKPTAERIVLQEVNKTLPGFRQSQQSWLATDGLAEKKGFNMSIKS
jgi:hypothetical protein